MLHSSHYQVAQLRQRVNESTISVLLTTHYSLLTTYYLLLLTSYLLLTTFYFLGSQLRQRVNESTITFELLHVDDSASRLGVTCGEGGSGGQGGHRGEHGTPTALVEGKPVSFVRGTCTLGKLSGSHRRGARGVSPSAW